MELGGDITPYFILIGLGAFAVTAVFAALVWQLVRLWKMLVDKEEKYNDTEIVALDEFLKRTKPKIWDHAKLLELQSKRNFRKKLEESLVEDFFEERNKQKEK